MSEIVSMVIDGVTTKVEVEEEESSHWENNGPNKEIKEIDLKEQLDKLIVTAHSIIEQLKKLSPDEAELSFGIKVSGSGKLLCFAEVGTEAQFNVKMTWK